MVGLYSGYSLASVRYHTDGYRKHGALACAAQCRDICVKSAIAGRLLPPGEQSPHDDFYSPVARFNHVLGSLDQRLAFAASGRLNDLGWNSTPDQEVPYPERPLQGQR